MNKRKNNTLRLPQFLKKVDELTNSMEHAKLQGFIHEIARTSSEEQRNRFLNILTEFTENNTSQYIIPNDDGKRKIIDEIQSIIKELETINQGEKCLDSEYNLDWDGNYDWYYDGDDYDCEEIIFQDHEGVLKIINRAIKLIHKCVDMSLFTEGCELYKKISCIEIHVVGDYVDYADDTLDLNDLYDHDLLSGRLENYLLESLYLTYMGNNLETRAEEIYNIFSCYRYCDVRLENLLQMGYYDLPEFEEFLPLWIDVLGKHSGDCEDRLIAEAQSMVEDNHALLENARKYADIHPELYLQLLIDKEGTYKDEKLLEIGQEAIDAIPINLVIRSEIALRAAEYAANLSRFDIMKQCWIETFRSHTTVINYLRIKFLSGDFSQYSDQVYSIIDEQYAILKKSRKRDFYYYDSHIEKSNKLHKNDYCFMMFFERDFETMQKVGMSIKEPLGWSSTFMKQGLSLMFLLLYNGSLLELNSGMSNMLERAKRECSFSCEEFYLGTAEKYTGTDKEKFIELIEKWKDTMNLSEEFINKWLKKIDKWIELRTEGIMNANRRNYYGECATFIAALGEVMESLGEDNARNNLMLQYKKNYSRRTAFRSELRALGMVE